MTTRTSAILGWAAVCISTAVACFWALWGIIENFHEGWWSESLVENIGIALVQYMAPMLLVLAPTAVALWRPRVGAVAFLLLGIAGAWFFSFAAPATTMIMTPCLVIGALFAFGDPRPRRRAALITLGLPLLAVIGFGAEPAWRVATRVDDGDRGERRVTANGVDLIWAPRGPGWPDAGCTWEEARRRVAHLSKDGTRSMESPQNVWRLPSVEEAVRSFARHGRNAGGRFDAATRTATYAVRPDKESPLWNPHSQVIYWWTSTEVDARRAYRVVFNGLVNAVDKTWRPAYLGFRAVRDPDEER